MQSGRGRRFAFVIFPRRGFGLGREFLIAYQRLARSEARVEDRERALGVGLAHLQFHAADGVREHPVHRDDLFVRDEHPNARVLERGPRDVRPRGGLERGNRNEAIRHGRPSGEAVLRTPTVSDRDAPVKEVPP